MQQRLRVRGPAAAAALLHGTQTSCARKRSIFQKSWSCNAKHGTQSMGAEQRRSKVYKHISWDASQLRAEHVRT
eukprot:1160698-Pelagomonas_calceolata.AAC.10